MRILIRPERRRWELPELYRHVASQLHVQLQSDEKRTTKVFIRGSTPVLFFGPLMSRSCRVLTIANNPSFGEFPQEFLTAAQYRFAHSGRDGLISDLSRVSPHQAESALRLMETYFSRSQGDLVYQPFFGGFRPFLAGLGLGTYGDGTAAHVDIATPFATTKPLTELEEAFRQSEIPSKGVDWRDLYSCGLTWFSALLALCPSPKVLVGIGIHGFEALQPHVDGWSECREIEQGVSAYFGRLTWPGREFPIVWAHAPSRWFPRRAMWIGDENAVERVGRGVAAALRELNLID